MLVPSVIFLGTPVALVTSVAAISRAPDRLFAAIALGLSALESVGLLALVWLFLLSA